MYTKIQPLNLAHCQTLKLKYRLYLVDVVRSVFYSLNNSGKTNISSC